MSRPDISIVIPYLNQPEHLGNCLRSLYAQTMSGLRMEVIVVDNGSNVMPDAACAPYANIRLAFEAEPGPGPARNKGVSLSQGLLLAFIDADCLADEDWLNTIVTAFDAEPDLQVVGGDVRIALENPQRVTMLEAYESVYAYRQKEYIEKQGFSGTGNLAMRRSCYERVGPFAGIGVAEDREWGKRATAMGHRIRYVPEMIVFHPARKNFQELQTKWDRHIAHDFNEQVHGRLDRLRWLAKAIALGASPIWETARILRSDRVSTVRERLLAWSALARIRLYRALHALEALFLLNSKIDAQKWNRNGNTPGQRKIPK